MLDVSFGGAALAGLLSFLSPCILPMVPFYLSYMAGLSVKELRDGGTIAPGARARLVVQALAFAIGVTTIFAFWGWEPPHLVAALPSGKSLCPMSRPGC